MAKPKDKPAEVETQHTDETEVAQTSLTVQEQSGGALAASDLMSQFGAAGEEFKEAMTRDDMAIPFLQILQPQSPQVTKGTTEYVKGAEAGQLFDTVSREIFATRDADDKVIPAPFHLVAVAYKDSYVEWKPREAPGGGGFVNEYDAPTGQRIKTVRNDRGQEIISSDSPMGTPGNQLVYTHTHYAFAVHENGSIIPYLITMSSTQVKPSRMWNASIARKALPNGKAAPRFFGRWEVTTTMRSNDSGNWYVWNILDAGTVLDFGEEIAARILEQASALRRNIEAGQVRVDHGAAQLANESTGESTGTAEGDDIPF